MKPEMIILVDENDNIIGEIERSKVGKENIYRVTGLWVTNSQGDILLAKRSLKKLSNPGLWGPAVAGTVEAGETYEDNIRKEAREEIGLTDFELKMDEKVFRDTGQKKYFCQWFRAVTDRDIHSFILQETEVDEVKWWSVNEVEKVFQETPSIFTKGFGKYYEMFRK